MAVDYRVLDLRANAAERTEVAIRGARSPEEAVRQALGVQVVRSGRRDDIVARVYWQIEGQPMNMVRLYTRPALQREPVDK